MNAESLASGGIAGGSLAIIVGKLFLNSIMSHIDTLKKQNTDCEQRYADLRKDFTCMQTDFIQYLGDAKNAQAH